MNINFQMKSTSIGVSMPMLYPQVQTEVFQPHPTHPEPQPQPTHPEPRAQPIYPEPQTEPARTSLQEESAQPLEPVNVEPYATHPESNSQNTILDINYDGNLISPDLEQGELYADYLTNPYNESKDVTKEATLYDPESPIHEINNPLLSIVDKQKSFSANATPIHSNKAQFASSDNVRQESSIFNFSSYFGAVNEKSGGEFDSLMPAQDG